MPSVKIKLGEQKQAIEPGIHLAEITEASDAISKAGNAMLKLTVKVGPLNFYSWIAFTENNSENVAKFAHAIGMKVVNDEVLSIQPDDCIGKVAKVELGPGEKISEKTGKAYLEIKRWLPPVTTDDTDVSGDEIPF